MGYSGASTRTIKGDIDNIIEENEILKQELLQIQTYSETQKKALEEKIQKITQQIATLNRENSYLNSELYKLRKKTNEIE